jgi:tetratricopeptide (TPR) repeat protein
MLYTELGNIYLKINKFSKAEKVYQTAIQLCEDSSFSKGQGELLLLLGEVYFRQDEFQKAKRQFVKAAEIFTLINDWYFLASTLQHMAFIMFEIKEYHDALLYLSRSVCVFLRLKSGEELSENYFLLGSIWQCLKCFDEAEDAITISLNYYHGEELGYAIRYQTMAIISIYKRKYNQAKEHYSKALRYYQYFGDSMKIGVICEELTLLLKYEDNLFKEKIQELSNLRNKEGQLPKYKLLLNFAVAMEGMGKNMHALKFGWKALELAKESEYQTKETEIFIQELSEKIRRNK